MGEIRSFQKPPSLNQYSGTWSEDAIRHLFRRTKFGVKINEIALSKQIGLTATIDLLLNVDAVLPSPPVKEYNPTNAAIPDVQVLAGQTWVNDPVSDGTVNALRRSSFKKWWVGQLVNQDNSIKEKMTLFWHNHFATESTDIGNAQYLYKHHALLRQHALGNFKSLVKQISIDPAMLIYLNGQNNNKAAPDENFAREIQELFVIGKGVGANFSETDVKEAARVLTGWRNNATSISSYFDITRHDTGNKQFSAFYGNRIISGRTGADAGLLELDDMLDMMFSSNEVALYICRRLYRWFIHYTVTPEIEQSIIIPLAQIFRENNYEIKPVLRVLLGSEHFFDLTNRGCQIKSPVDLMVGMLREMEVRFPDNNMYVNQYGLWNQIVNYLNNLQQNLGDPPDVSGWKAYYQEPGFYKYWISSDTLPKRIQYLDILVTTGYTFGGFKLVVDSANWIKSFSNPGDPNLLINELCNHLLGVNLSLSHKNQIKTDILLAGQSQDYYWTDAWNLYITQPSNTPNTKHVVSAVTMMVKYLVNLPEYQLC